MRVKKWLPALAAIIAAALILSACGGAQETGEASGEVKAFTINASNFEFDVKEIKVNKGDTVKITLNNREGMHAVKFAGYNKEVQEGETITFVANKTGEFDYICSIFCGAGHGDMIGKLIVQ